MLRSIRSTAAVLSFSCRQDSTVDLRYETRPWLEACLTSAEDHCKNKAGPPGSAHNMHTQRLLDFVVFQLTPTRVRCELHITAGDETEKLASGLLKPFLVHMLALKEQLAKGGQSIRLQPPLHPHHSSWFTKATLLRFVRFVSNPEVLEHVSTIQMELMQLEETIRMQTRSLSSAHPQGFCTNLSTTALPKGRKQMTPTNYQQIVNQGDFSGSDGDNMSGNSRELLLHALDVRHAVLWKEQGTSFACAAAAGFDIDHLADLILFSDCFGAVRLREACIQFINVYKKRQEAGFCTAGPATAAGIPLAKPLVTQPKCQCSFNSHVSDDESPRLLDEGCNFLGTDLRNSVHGAVCVCIPDEDDQTRTYSVATEGEGHGLNKLERRRVGEVGAGISNGDIKLYSCNLQRSFMQHAGEGIYTLAIEDPEERERAVGMVTQLSACSSDWCRHHAQVCCCCRRLLDNQRICASFCLASCEARNSCHLPESKLSSSSQEAPGEATLDDFPSSGSVLSHHLICSTSEKLSADNLSSVALKQDMAVPLRESENDHEHERLSTDMVVVNNQIFSVPFLVNPAPDDGKNLEMVSEPCNDDGCSKDMKHELMGTIRTLDTTKLKPQLSSSTVKDSPSGSLNPLYQEGIQESHDTVLLVDPTKAILKDFDFGASIIHGYANKVGINLQNFEPWQDPTMTNCNTAVAQARGHILEPSEERVKKFLDRYHEKRQLKLRRLSNTQTEETKLDVDTMQAWNKNQDNNHKPEELILSFKHKPQTCKGNIPTHKKVKVDEEQKRTDTLKGCHQGVGVRTHACNTLATRPTLRSPGSMKSTCKMSRVLQPPIKASVAGLSPKKKSEAESLSGSSKLFRNPLTCSAPSLRMNIQGKTVQTANVRASINSHPSVNKKGRTSVQSKPNSLCMVSRRITNKDHGSSKPLTRQVRTAAHSIKDPGVCSERNGKLSSLPDSNSIGSKEGPRNFLRKGAGASRYKIGAMQLKSLHNKEVAIQHKGAHLPSSESQAVEVSQERQSSVLSKESSTPIAQNFTVHSPKKSSTDDINGRECISQQGSEKQVEGNRCASSPPQLDSALQRTTRLMHDSQSMATTVLHKEARPPICADFYVTSEGKNQFIATQMLPNSISVDSFSYTATEFPTPSAPIEPPSPMQSNSHTHSTCNPFEIPSGQGPETPNARYFVEESDRFHRSGVSDVSPLKPESQSSEMKWGASRHINFTDPHPLSSRQGKDLRKFLKFGRKSARAPADQASSSIFSEEDDRGSFSENGSKIIDCYGRKRQSSGKACRASGNDTAQHCSSSPSTPEQDESKSHRSIITFRRSISTQEVPSKFQARDPPKTSAAKGKVCHRG